MENDIIEKQISQFPINKIKDGFKVDFVGKELTHLSFKLKINKIIFPSREGEFIKDISKLSLNKEYSLSYPGTASTKSMVLFTSNDRGIFIGSVPSYEFAKIKIKRTNKNNLLITYNSTEHKLFFIPFKNNWRKAANYYKKIINIDSTKIIKRKPKYFLQIGVKDSHKNCFVKHFSELKKIIDYFHSQLGPKHIIHFFGTNKDGFDRMLPDFTIDPKIGGKESLIELIEYTKNKGFLTSHHYNPRIADSDWIKQNPKYRSAIVRKKDKSLVFEHYKEHKHYVMNPNHKKWFNSCMQTVQYLKSIGFDYIQLDQFTYQRNFYNPQKPIQLGYKKMIKEFEKLNIKFWLEGVSDIHKLKNGNFYQILTRDNCLVWEDNENRRGYPYGISYPYFFMYLYPNKKVSYQLITEKNHLSEFKHKLKIARKINAAIYDLQMSFYNKKYMTLLEKSVDRIKKYDL